MRRKPATLQTLEDAVGTEAAIEVCRRLGGQRVYFPLDPPADHRLCHQLGLDIAQRLGQYLGGSQFEIPIVPEIALESRDAAMY